jgi:hypothetical protein
MDLGGGVGDAWEILANVGGNRPAWFVPGKLPYVQAGPLGRALLVTGVLLMAPGVATAAWEK